MRLWGRSAVCGGGVCFVPFARLCVASPCLSSTCWPQGNKKLDKAEILEMSIEYLQRMHNQTFGKSGGGCDLNCSFICIAFLISFPSQKGGGSFDSQREWASELSTWVLQNKMVFSGPNALDQFCQALLVHLQSMMGSQSSLSSATSILLGQVLRIKRKEPF